MPLTQHPYASASYANAFAGIFDPLPLPATGGYVLKRPIPASVRCDAAGCYPLSVLGAPEQTRADLAALGAHGIVSLVLVADAFFGPAPEALRQAFALVRPFKAHHVHDYALPFSYRRHHQYEVRLALAECRVAAVALEDHLGDWRRLYDALVQRRRITGLQRFSASYFEALCALPGLHALAAFRNAAVVGMHLFVEHHGVAYSHLACADEAGYRHRAGYALNDYAIGHFRGGRLIDFGAGAGALDEQRDGLAAFKRGFANRRETFHLCGQVLDAPAYAALVAARRPSEPQYFPAYRG